MFHVNLRETCCHLFLGTITELEKEQTKSKVSRKMKIIDIRAEMKAVENIKIGGKNLNQGL